MPTIEWVAVRKFGPRPIGAVGFIGPDAVAMIAFYDDADGNRDGRVGWGEWIASKISPISLKGRNVTEVAMQGRVEPDIILRDSSFPQLAARLFASFASGLVLQGYYQAYFARPVSLIGGGIARRITQGMVKEMVVRKGFETAVKRAFMTAAA
jgi:hypothetical protein